MVVKKLQQLGMRKDKIEITAMESLGHASDNNNDLTFRSQSRSSLNRPFYASMVILCDAKYREAL